MIILKMTNKIKGLISNGYLTIDISFLYLFCIFYINAFTGALVGWYQFLTLSSLIFAVFFVKIKLEIKITTILISLGICLVYSILNFINIDNCINGDHWYHIQSAYAIVENFVVGNQFYLAKYKYKDVFFLYSIAITSILFILQKIYTESRNLVLIILLFVWAAVYQFNLSNGDPHPPLRNLPLVLTGILGIESMSFRAQGLIPLFILTSWILERGWESHKKYLLIIFLLSIPAIYFNSLLVEFSIWSFSVLTIFLLAAIDRPIFSDNNLYKIGIAFILTSMIRQPMIAGVAIVIACAISQRSFKVVFGLLVLSLPVFLILIKNSGISPATYVPDEVFLNIPQNLSLIARTYYSLHAENLLYIFATTGPLMLLILGLGVSILVIRKQFRVLVIFCLTLAIFWLLFHSIRPILWGVPRYQIEYLVPLVVGGGFLVMQIPRVGFVFIVIATIFNVSTVINFSNNINKYKVDFPEVFLGVTPYLSETPFNLVSAINAMNDNCRGDGVKFTGISPTYGNIPLVFANVDIVDYFQSLSNKPICTYEMVWGYFPDAFYNSQRNTSVIFRKSDRD